MNSLFKMQSQQEYKNAYNQVQPSLSHHQGNDLWFIALASKETLKQ